MMMQTPEGLIVGLVGVEQSKVEETKAAPAEEPKKQTARKPRESK